MNFAWRQKPLSCKPTHLKKTAKEQMQKLADFDVNINASLQKLKL